MMMTTKLPGAACALRSRASCAVPRRAACDPPVTSHRQRCSHRGCSRSSASPAQAANPATTPRPASLQLRLGASASCATSATRGGAAVFASAPSDDDSMEVEIKIEGMMCGGCTSRVEEVIKKMDGVRKVAVNLETKLALVEVKAASQMDALQVLPALVQAVKDLGFEAEPHFS